MKLGIQANKNVGESALIATHICTVFVPVSMALGSVFMKIGCRGMVHSGQRRSGALFRSEGRDYNLQVIAGPAYYNLQIISDRRCSQVGVCTKPILTFIDLSSANRTARRGF